MRVSFLFFLKNHNIFFKSIITQDQQMNEQTHPISCPNVSAPGNTASGEDKDKGFVQVMAIDQHPLKGGKKKTIDKKKKKGGKSRQRRKKEEKKC